MRVFIFVHFDVRNNFIDSTRPQVVRVVEWQRVLRNSVHLPTSAYSEGRILCFVKFLAHLSVSRQLSEYTVRVTPPSVIKTLY